MIGRSARATDATLREVMAIIVRQPHAGVKEIEPTQEAWSAAVRFPTVSVPLRLPCGAPR